MVAQPHQPEPEDDGWGDFFDPTLDPDRFEGVHIVTSDKEAMELFDMRARYELGISGEEFLRRWDNGQYREYRQLPDTPEGRRISRVAWLIPTLRLEKT